MPYEYAIHDRSPDPKGTGFIITYDPTDEQTARANASGYWRIVTHWNHPMTHWIPFRDVTSEYVSDSKTWIESTGQKILPGDFVLTTVASRKELILGEVIGFTKYTVKVRIFNEEVYGDEKPSLKNSEHLVKFDRGMIF